MAAGAGEGGGAGPLRGRAHLALRPHHGGRPGIRKPGGARGPYGAAAARPQRAMSEPAGSFPDDLDPAPEEVAVVGMAGRFPGAAGLDELWRNLRDGVESISFFTDEELQRSGIPPELA